MKIKTLRSDHSNEFHNESFEKICEQFGISRNFHAPRTPQHNDVIERKKKISKEPTRIMLNKIVLPKYVLVDAVSPTFYILNKLLLRAILKLILYDFFTIRKPNMSHLRVFGCKSFVLNNRKSILDV